METLTIAISFSLMFAAFNSENQGGAQRAVPKLGEFFGKNIPPEKPKFPPRGEFP